MIVSLRLVAVLAIGLGVSLAFSEARAERKPSVDGARVYFINLEDGDSIVSTRVRSSASGFKSGRFLRMFRMHSSRISSDQRARTRFVLARRRRRSRSGAG